MAFWTFWCGICSPAIVADVVFYFMVALQAGEGSNCAGWLNGLVLLNAKSFDALSPQLVAYIHFM